MSNDRRTFLEERRTGIGGSDIGAILGVDPWRNAMDVYFSKTRPVVIDSEPSVDIQRGNILEPIARSMYQKKTDRTVLDPPHEAIRHHSDDWAIVHPDGVLPDENGALELKAPRARGYRMLTEHGGRDSYILQGMWACHVMGADFCGFGFINLECEPIMTTFDVEVDRQIANMAVQRADRFWHEHVLKRIPPTLSDWMRPDKLVLAEPEVEPTSIFVADKHPDWPTWRKVIAAFVKARDLKKRAESQEDAARDALRTHMIDNGYNAATIDRVGKVYCNDRDGRLLFNDALLRQSTPLDFDRLMALFIDMANEWGISDHAASDLVTQDVGAFLSEYAIDLDDYRRRTKSYNELRVYADIPTEEE